MTMKRTHLNALVDGIAFIAFLLLLSTGLLLEYQLPAGSGGLQGYGSGHGASDRPVHMVWGWTRHEWGQLHYWLALAMMAVLAFHVVLHWKWIVCIVQGKPSTTSGHRLILGVVGLAFAVLLAMVPLMGGKTTISRGELRAEAGNANAGSVAAPHNAAGESESVRGSMSLREISQRTGIPVAKLIENIGLPTNVDIDAGAGRLLRQHNRSMNDLRKAISDLQSAEPQRSDKAGSGGDDQ